MHAVISVYMCVGDERNIDIDMLIYNDCTEGERWAIIGLIFCCDSPLFLASNNCCCSFMCSYY